MIRRIHDLHLEAAAARRPAISFEFFPPKTDEGEANLFGHTLPQLIQAKPLYCSVTYGAGGGTREKTLTVVDRIQREFDLTTIMHLTCVNATRDQLGEVLSEARQRGIQNILALRGDPPAGGAAWTQTDGGFEYSHQLVAFVRELGGFDVGTAGFPEGHIAQTRGRQVDWDFLAQKVRAGAQFVLTQLFFDNADYFAFRDYLTKKCGVDVPLIPGLMPVLSRHQTKKFTQMCGARLPEPFLQRLDTLGDDDAAVTDFGVEYCSRQVEELLRQGAPGIHFYTLNKANSTLRVLRNLGLAG